MKGIQEVKAQGVVTAYRAFFRFKGRLYSKQSKQLEEVMTWLVEEKKKSPRAVRQAKAFDVFRGVQCVPDGLLSSSAAGNSQRDGDIFS